MGNILSQKPVIDRGVVFVHIVISLIFIILILVLLWTNNDTFDTIGEKLKYTYETFHYKLIKGAKFFHSLSKDENLEEYIRDKNEALIFFLAPWCKDSKKLKRSGILEKISKTRHVIIIDDLHPDTEILMNTIGLEIFPSLCVYKKKKLTKYKKFLNEENLKEFI